MKTPDFRKMSDEELSTFQCRSQEEAEALTNEKAFRKWRAENASDLEDDEARAMYSDATGETFWEDLDENDRRGWDHNMTKD